MKTTLRIVSICMLAAAFAPTTWAFTTTTHNFPDGGSSAALIGLGSFGLVAVSRLFRKK